MRFKQYFQNWLYDTNGYYANYKTIGKEGDFYTSVSTSSFFGGTIAKKIVDSIKENRLPKNCNIVEIGAHHGYLLADIIQFIYTLNPKLLSTLEFIIIEKFDSLQKKQEKYLKQCFGNSIKLKFYKNLEELKLEHAFIVANEIFDAFTCDLVFTKKDQLHLGFIKEHKIYFEPCNDKKIIEHCKKYKITKGEVCLSYQEFANTLCKNIKNFEFITFDYGDKYPRNDFSARVYSKHKVFALFEENLELEKLYKKSDLTYDVCFNHLSDCFKANKIKEVKFNTQMNSLIEFGIIELLEILKANVDENTYLREAQKVKTLLEPTGMGDRFKTLYIKK